MKTDIEIAQETKMLPITTVASQYGITEDDLELYGKYKAKISNELWIRWPFLQLTLLNTENICIRLLQIF